MNRENTTTIEVNGIKMEVDLRHAKRIDNFRVGDRVKVLKKEYGGHKVHHGVIIGFEMFEKLPTIIVAHSEIGYNDVEIKFLYFNSESEETEIIAAREDDSMALDKSQVMDVLDRKVAKLKSEIDEIESRRAYFERNFQAYWMPASEIA